MMCREWRGHRGCLEGIVQRGPQHRGLADEVPSPHMAIMPGVSAGTGGMWWVVCPGSIPLVMASVIRYRSDQPGGTD